MKVPYAYASPLDRVSQEHRRVIRARRETVETGLDRLPRHGWRDYDLEIGCGHGHFLAAYAAAHPQRYCVGIDIAGGRLERARKKSSRAALDNVSWIHSEALLFLECLPGAITFSRVFILFPDPWPKRRHHKHRLVQPRFLELLSSVCRPEATLYFRSDDGNYTQQARNSLIASAFWDIRPAEAWPWERASVFQERAARYESLVARKTPTGFSGAGGA